MPARDSPKSRRRSSKASTPLPYHGESDRFSPHQGPKSSEPGLNGPLSQPRPSSPSPSKKGCKGEARMSEGGPGLAIHPAPTAGGHLPLRSSRCSSSPPPPQGLPLQPPAGREGARRGRTALRPGVCPPHRLHVKRKGRRGGGGAGWRCPPAPLSPLTPSPPSHTRTPLR